MKYKQSVYKTFALISQVCAMHGYLRDMRMKIRKTKTKIEQGGMKQHE